MIFIKYTIIIAGFIVAIFLIIIGIMMMFNRKLKTKIKERTTKIEELSNTDELTGLYNRRKLFSIFNNFINIPEKRFKFLSVIIIDIDYFKRINDTYGHNTGDKVLKIIANLIHDSIREDDFCGRWGGEEFLLLCIRCNLNDAIVFAEKIRKKIEQHEFSLPMKITSSFGVFEWGSGIEIDEAIAMADKALYYSKENGRNLVTGIDKNNKFVHA